MEKLTLRKVAERAQIGHATIAYYFQSRRELIDAALLEMSSEFLLGLRQQRRVNGTRGLEALLLAFLDPVNPTARFVIQMIDAGLHDADLRRSHDEFVQYGRESIRLSIEAGVTDGELREDLDAGIAASLFHSVLVWWEAEVIAGVETAEDAQRVALLLLSLLQGNETPPHEPVHRSRAPEPADTSTLDIIESALTNDPRLSSKATSAIAAAVRGLYEFAVDPPADSKDWMSNRA